MLAATLRLTRRTTIILSRLLANTKWALRFATITLPFRLPKSILLHLAYRFRLIKKQPDKTQHAASKPAHHHPRRRRRSSSVHVAQSLVVVFVVFVVSASVYAYHLRRERKEKRARWVQMRNAVEEMERAERMGADAEFLVLEEEEIVD
ncbi:hypothetical protein BU26DRAFT_553728 [Trematosphaeria pertusa]|uniref:Transmembrane protein n=1 Tax=Trematosphaeria pertusa TaxID=390896 RepID=A0A6A6I239_9PLEO|nr:uncharacterized protein BU26DRAFT_553728 [Trematosphaeria pertusa]KAF2244535.1 hypothetical protein BU26DRAFT_553728 [Trematosphaeria pertusa]